MECQPQNPEFRNNPENFLPWAQHSASGERRTSDPLDPSYSTTESLRSSPQKG